MSFSPCKNCERKGCGAYHDKCDEYQKFVAELIDIKIKKSNLYKKVGRKESLSEKTFNNRGVSLRKYTGWYQKKGSA